MSAGWPAVAGGFKEAIMLMWSVIIGLCVLTIWLWTRLQRVSDELRATARRMDELELVVRGVRGEVRPGGEAIASVLGEPAAGPAASVPPRLPPPLPPVMGAGAAEAAPPVPEAGAAVGGRRPGVPSLVNWEQFLGVKLFAWIGGFILFLGVAFFVKHAFENNLISPEVRVAIGFAVGVGLVVGGLWVSRERNVVTVQTLCGTGVLILYSNIFAAHAFYKLIGLPAAYLMMTLVTAAAFGLAVRLGAQVVAVLGLLGGFLTPLLLSTGVDRPWALFGYVAALDVGLVLVALRKRWDHLVLLAAVATLVMQGAWVLEFFRAEKISMALGIHLFFVGLFIAALLGAHQRHRAGAWTEWAAALMPAGSFLFVLFLLVRPYPAVAERVGLLFGFVFAVDLGVLLVSWVRPGLRAVQAAAGSGVFLLLLIWTGRFLREDLLLPALGFFLAFAGIHAIAPVVMQWRRPVAGRAGWAHIFPALGLVLVSVPFFKLEAVSLWVWPVVMLMDAVAFLLALVTASVVSVVAVFLLTMLVTGLWIIQVPLAAAEVPAFLAVIAGFAIFFAIAGVMAARRITVGGGGGGLPGGMGVRGGGLSTVGLPAEVFGQVVALGGVLPFLLLNLVVWRLPLEEPQAVFGVALVLALVYLGVMCGWGADGLAAAGLAGVLLLGHSWHVRHLGSAAGGAALPWIVGLAGAFLVFPFVFRARLQRRWVPWAVSALAFPLHYYLVHALVVKTWPGMVGAMGLVPGVLAIPSGLGLGWLARTLPAELATRNTLLAWFGAATLFFVTLVIPVQFDREWITIGWGLEGLALLWLLRRVPHAGLQWAGTGLLVVAFVRLALNPAVLGYHERSGQPILNWYLYAYGVVSLCLMLGAGLLTPPRNRLWGVNVRAWLYGMGTVLIFLLVNIEIADYFSTGWHLTFQFNANLGQDMTYSLAWGLFAFGLLAVGFWRDQPAVRYAGMGLLVVTVIKIFLHDLWRLGGMYRVGSLVGLALVLIVVSFIYQRFLSARGRETTGVE